MPGFAFRASAAYVTDGAGDAYAAALNFATGTYPDAAILAQNGETAGWETTNGMESFDISTSVDVRFAGAQRLGGSGTPGDFVNEFRINTTGNKIVRGGSGIATYATPDDYARVFDNTSQLVVLWDDSDGHTGNNTYDAASNLISISSWGASNVSVSANIATGPMYLKVGRGTGGGRAHLSYFYYEDAATAKSPTIKRNYIASLIVR